MPAKDPSRSWLCVLRQPTDEQRATLLAKAGDRTLVFKAGLLELEGGGVQAWFAARDPNKLAVMKVPASWMQRNILNVGWHRSEMERWDELSDSGSAWRTFDNSTVQPIVRNGFRRWLPSFLQPMQVDKLPPPEPHDGSQVLSQEQPQQQ